MSNAAAATDPSKGSQCAAILAHLKAGHRITPAQAFQDFHCLRLGGRIKDLRNAGHPIITEMITVKTTPSGRPVRVARYSISQEPVAF